MNGWVKIHRELEKWEWYHDSKMVHLLFHLIMKASTNDKHWKGISIKRGQAVVGLHSLSEQTGISIRSLRTCLDRLVQCGEIDKQTTNKFSLITVLKYDKFQYFNHENTDTDKQTTNKRQTNDNILRTKEYKEDKGDVYKRVKHRGKYLDPIKQNTFDELISQGYTKDEIDSTISDIENYTKGNYKSGDLVLRKWIKRNEPKSKTQKKIWI